MKIAASFPRVYDLSLNIEKEMLVVIGDVDPVCIVNCLRKKQGFAQIISVVTKKKIIHEDKDKDGDDDDNKVVPGMYSNPPYGYGYECGCGCGCGCGYRYRYGY